MNAEDTIVKILSGIGSKAIFEQSAGSMMLYAKHTAHLWL